MNEGLSRGARTPEEGGPAMAEQLLVAKTYITAAAQDSRVSGVGT